jgi:hypothetical protein
MSTLHNDCNINAINSQGIVMIAEDLNGINISKLKLTWTAEYCLITSHHLVHDGHH